MTTTYFDELVFEKTSREEAQQTVFEYHYSAMPNNVKKDLLFRLRHEDELLGVMAFGDLAGANAWQKYADSPQKVTELRRMALKPGTVTNTASFFIGKALRWLKENSDYEVVVSYADPFYGHSGSIYRATNFEYRGKTPNTSPRIIWGGRAYHNRTRHKRRPDGSLTPIAEQLQLAIKSGEAILDYKNISKHIYVKQLR